MFRWVFVRSVERETQHSKEPIPNTSQTPLLSSVDSAALRRRGEVAGQAEESQVRRVPVIGSMESEGSLRHRGVGVFGGEADGCCGPFCSTLLLSE